MASDDEIESSELRGMTLRARVANAFSGARSEWEKSAVPTSANRPDGGWRPLFGGDVFQLFLGDHSELTFGDEHPGMKYVIVARDIDPHETQIPIFVAGRYKPSVAWMVQAAKLDDWHLFPPTRQGGPAFCKAEDILVDATKAPTLLRRRFEKKPGRQNRFKGNIGLEHFGALQDAHAVGMQLTAQRIKALG